jgi:hypothetical protein
MRPLIVFVVTLTLGYVLAIALVGHLQHVRNGTPHPTANMQETAGAPSVIGYRRP